MNKRALAATFGVSTKTVQRWVAAGCPHERAEDGELRFELHKVTTWRREHGAEVDARALEDAAPAPTVEPAERPLSIREAGQRADAARKAAQARRQEHELQQEKGLKELGLAEKVRAATSSTDLADLAREITAHVAAGALSPQRGQALRQLLTETRHSLRARERETGATDDGRMILVTEEARQVAEEFDKVANGWRRQWIREAIAAHLAEDLLEFPARLDGDLAPIEARLQIDAMGDPTGERPPEYAPPMVPPARRSLQAGGVGPVSTVPRPPESAQLRGSIYRPWLAQRLASRSPAETRVVVAARQVGKSVWGAWETLRTAAERPRSFSAVLAPTYQIAQTAINRLKELVRAVPGAVWREQKKRFVLRNGSIVAVFSADRKETVRGPTIDATLWIDEGAYLSEQAYEAALGALGAGNGRVVVTTTPAGKNWVWKEFTSRDPANACFRFRAVESPYTNRERLERLRKKLSVEKAAQEFDAVFVDDLLLAFPDTSRLFVKSFPDRWGEKDLKHVLGLDLGKEQDWLVATLMNRHGEARIVARWRHRSWADTLPQLSVMAKDLRALVVVDHGVGGGYGGVVKDHLERDGLPVLAIKTAVVGTKGQLIEQLRADVQNERIKVQENEHSGQLRHELAVFQGIRRVHHGQELMVYEGPQLEGEFDDWAPCAPRGLASRVPSTLRGPNAPLLGPPLRLGRLGRAMPVATARGRARTCRGDVVQPVLLLQGRRLRALLERKCREPVSQGMLAQRVSASSQCGPA